MTISPNITEKPTTYMEQGDRSRPRTTRPTLYASNFAISTGHWLTSHAGMRMLMTGGNAFDATVAAVFAAAVVEPASSFSLGSEAVFAFWSEKRQKAEILSGQGTAPAAMTPQFFADRGLKMIPTGPGRAAPLSFTTPGMVAAALTMLADHGTKSVTEVLSSAVSYARDGIANYEYMISRIEPDALEQLRLFDTKGSEIFFTDGKPNQPGTRLLQSALAASLTRLSKAETDCAGTRTEKIEAARACFYEGMLGTAIAKASAELGGLLTAEDLHCYTPRYEAPVSTEYHGYEVHGQSFWSQAPVMQQALNMLEHFDLKSLGHNTAGYIHVVCEVMKLAMADREAFYGDPEFSEIPMRGLLDKAYAGERATLVDPLVAADGLPPPGAPWTFSGEAAVAIVSVASTERELVSKAAETGTTHISVVDSAGNFVATTPSGGAFTKSVYLSELGFTLSTRSEMFNLSEGHPNVLVPCKRPRTSLVNYLVTRGGRPIMTIGCPGGDAQVQANLQVFLNTVIWDMSPQEAVEAPRFATLSAPNSFFPHGFLKGQLALESGFDTQTRDALDRLGHRTIEVATCGMGAVITRWDEDNRIIATSADPRRSSYAYGW